MKEEEDDAEQMKIEEIKDLLEQPIAARTLSNIQKLVELTKNYQFIQNDLLSQENGERTHQLVCQYMNYYYAEKDRNLFSLGNKHYHLSSN